ncbi:transketolase [Stella humosa]|uniref:Transketolase n=1 Tax=Stella humosa TaxID=94 RepID=A0A3N1LKM6_9PROT|nr:transketolase [Stella humosa]ROP91289.1 transketolase [Stella humosa]BBK34356.1 transketolase [Stella humosa]
MSNAPTATDLRAMANAVRALSMDAVEAAKSGHPGMPMGMADVAAVLFTRFLAYDPADPAWPDRDRFVLSAGHGSMLLYSLLHLTGYADMTMDELRRFRQLGSRTAGHPEYGHAAGIETTTGPLGQGLATAVGMAIAERHLNAAFGDALVDHRTYVIAGDGCLMEGISHEAISLAGHLKLGRLIVLFDDNNISIDGATALSVSDDQQARFRASGWDVQAVDGHDPEAVAAAIAAAQATDTPSLIACRTQIAYGAPTKAGTSGAHGSPLGAAEIAGAREKLGWDSPAFVVPDSVLSLWRNAGRTAAKKADAWRQRHAAAAARAEFDRRMAGELPAGLSAAMAEYKAGLIATPPKVATRQASGSTLDVVAKVMPELVGGSADLTPSNNTKAKGQAVLEAGKYGGTYLHYGVREFGMAAAMNGLALHGGVVPYGGTFLVFTDYARPAIRLSALMGIRVVYVMTHDSIGLGEDGPTHQPVEHLAALRCIPNLRVFRPADAVETAECWELALAAKANPSVIALTRQGVPTLRTDATENRSARGAYVLAEAEAEGARAVTLLATGSEVGLAMEARALLAKEGIAAAVVSMPSWELFAEQDAAYRAAVLGSAPRVAVEAAVRLGWDRWMGDNGVFVGMPGFGASAPAGELYRHFGITAEAVAAAAKGLV